MWIIDFAKANCKNCYACVRVCKAHAVKVINEQATIMEERCIGCGKCLEVCPKNAKHISSELGTVKMYIRNGEKIAVSIAPSYVAVFGKNSRRVYSALKQLGFNRVEETVVGAEVVTRQYEEYIINNNKPFYITSCCPTINQLIEKHYPELIDYLLPFMSPAECHLKMIKDEHPEYKTVFIGPCLSKKTERMDSNYIDSVITFEELVEWLDEENIIIDDLEEHDMDKIMQSQRMYPLRHGVTQTINKERVGKEIIVIDGIDECLDTLPHILNGEFEGTILEVHGCRNGCINGPGMPKDNVNVYERKRRVMEFIRQEEMRIAKENKLKLQEGVASEVTVDEAAVSNISEQKNNTSSDKLGGVGINYSIGNEFHKGIYKQFKDKKQVLKMPGEEEIQQILRSLGKETMLDELNCGSCGYPTCRDKAIAVYNNFAEPNMCLPFMRQKAEDMTNIIFKATPNMIVMIGKKLEIVEINPAAKKFFKITKAEARDLLITDLVEADIFNEVLKTKQNIFNRKATLKLFDKVVIESLIWIDEYDIMLWIANDITVEDEKRKKLIQMKMDAIDMTQEVINKQMRTAQEIASLLGESTAETKVTLSRLKNMLKE